MSGNNIKCSKNAHGKPKPVGASVLDNPVPDKVHCSTCQEVITSRAQIWSVDDDGKCHCICCKDKENIVTNTATPDLTSLANGIGYCA